MATDREKPGDGAAATPVARRLAAKRVAAQTILYLEALAPRLLPLLSVVAVFLALVWFGYFRHVPAWLHIATLAVFGLASVGLALRLAGIGWPSTDSAWRMLERRNGLAHQAIRLQEDRPAGGDAFSDALWREHQARMARLIGRLDVGTPQPDIARHDRHALRAVPLLLLAVAFAFSYSNRGGLIADVAAFRAPAEAAPDVRIDAWVTPPAHTARAPVFLTGSEAAEKAEVRIPQFSELTVRVTGGSGTEAVLYRAAGEETVTALRPEAGTAEAGKAPAAAVKGAETMRYTILKDGTLDIAGRQWTFSVIPDRVPEIAFDGTPRRTVAAALEIGFVAKDDYGLQEAHAEIVPVDEAPDARPLYPLPEYRLDLPRRSAREAKGTASRNLSEHPLAGKRVRITLVARDAAGQEGRSQPVEMVLPARTFTEPLAAAVAEQRQVFALDARRMPEAIALAEALTIRPEETIPNLTHYLLIESAAARMRLSRTEDQMRETADYLWEIALGIEDGNLSLADRRLRDAQKALAEALERNASDEEIAKLMQELRDAMQAYMEELARQAAKNGEMRDNAMQQRGQVLRQQDLQRMLDQIENLARSGARDQAQQLLSELQRMMNNLQAGRPQQQGPQNDAMRREMDRLGQLMQRQQQLMEETFRLDQALRDRMLGAGPSPEENGEMQPGDRGEGKPSPDQMTEEQLRQALKDLKAQQDALGEMLGELQKGLKGMGMEPGEGFAEAGREMEGASESLGEGQGEPAVGSQGRALEALRKGAQTMMSQMQAMMGEGQGEGQGLPQAGRNGRDPLGRERQADSQGPDFGGPTKVPEEIDIQRAREILEEIRRRLGTGASPGFERDYLERLLGIR
ncbi:TIGR02302 family protein [Shinella pollutisoli]|uniref:TIGR02302 family protein n=1 Tax=Shinella pollutisoli TaxID=2250594 RepID=A0ABV7DKW4_9HYPH|nr:TIGR02302 family protein [Shinella pollutisoli]